MTGNEQMGNAAAQTTISSLKSDAMALLDKAAEVAVIASPEQEARAAEFRAQVKLRLKKADEARTFLVKPLNDHVKRINAEVKQATGPMEEADAIVANGMIRWRNSEQVRLAKETADQAALAAQVAVRSGDLDTMQKKAIEHAEAIAVAPKTVQTQSGKLSYRKVKRWEIEDVEKIPAAYWMIDEDKIAASIKADFNIPGVKTWTEEIPVISS